MNIVLPVITLSFEDDCCNDCPFYEQEFVYCKAAVRTHPMGDGGELGGIMTMEERPKWCPLEKHGYIKVRFK